LVIGRFIAAIQRKDAKAIHALILNEEKEKMGVTEQVIASSLEQMLYKQASQVKAIPLFAGSADGFRADRWYRQHNVWVDARSGQPLQNLAGSGQLVTMVNAYRPEHGPWQVSFTQFARSFLRLNLTKPQLQLKGTVSAAERDRAYEYERKVLKQWGIANVVPDPPITLKKGQWIVVSGVKQSSQSTRSAN
jgi:hypothetical protein